MAPHRPKSALQRLPPILRKICQTSISGYSKGSRGLSVLPRVRGIFTTSTISPSPSLRQCSSRYAVHARRNLPDKELRYLRTVQVVTSQTNLSISNSVAWIQNMIIKVDRTFLPASTCRHADRTISSTSFYEATFATKVTTSFGV